MENRVEFEMCGHKFVFDTKDVREEEKWAKDVGIMCSMCV